MATMLKTMVIPIIFIVNVVGVDVVGVDVVGVDVVGVDVVGVGVVGGMDFFGVVVVGFIM